MVQQPQAQGQGQAASLSPEDQVKGGGPPVQQNLRIDGARFNYWDYNGTAPQTFALKINFTSDAGVQYEQQYSVGDPTRFMPSGDGKQAIMLGTTKGISDSSNAGVFLKHLVDAGFDQAVLGGGDISVIEGIYGYWDGVSPPARSGGIGQRQNQQGQAGGGKQFESIILVLFQMLQPGQQATVTAANSAAAQNQQAPAAPVAPAAPGQPGTAAAPTPAAPTAAPPGVAPAPAPAPTPTPTPTPTPAAPVTPAPATPPVPQAPQAVQGQVAVAEAPPVPQTAAVPVPVAPVAQTTPAVPETAVAVAVEVAVADPVPEYDLQVLGIQVAQTVLSANPQGFTTQNLMGQVFASHPDTGTSPFRDQLANYIVSQDFINVLIGQGYQVNGATISK